MDVVKFPFGHYLLYISSPSAPAFLAIIAITTHAQLVVELTLASMAL